MKNSTCNLLMVSVWLIVAACGPKPPKKEFPAAPATTGNAESLTQETREPSNEFYPRVSPDGKYIYYNLIESTRSGGSFNLTSLLAGGDWFDPVVVTNKRTKIIRKEIGMPTTNPLKDNAADPAIMPNGNILFTYVLPSKPVIAYCSPEGVGINYISQSEMGDDDSQPIMSSKGDKIIFSTLIGGHRMICSMDAKGGSFTVITEGYKPLFLPNDDNKIVYNFVVNKNVQIFTLDLKTGQKSQLTTGEYDNKDAAYTRDGRLIAFVSDRENPKAARHHVYTMKSDGTEIKQITQGETDEADPAWGIDNTLFFACNAAKNYSIWKVRPRI